MKNNKNIFFSFTKCLIAVIVILLIPFTASSSGKVEHAHAVKYAHAANQAVRAGLYYSVKGRPIEVYVFGAGKRTILVIGGIHGNETPGVSLARSFLDYLKSSNPRDILGLNCRIVMIPVANPDGLKTGTRVNARQIDINRNFPTGDFGNGSFYGGKKPASEPETSAIINVADKYKPSLIITFHAFRGCVNYDGPAAAIAGIISKRNGLPVQSYIGYPTPGSLGTYYGHERDIPVITLELLPGNGQWARHKNALLAAIGSRGY